MGLGHPFVSAPSEEVVLCAFGTLERGSIMTSVGVARNLSQFDTGTFLSTIDRGKKIADFAKKGAIFIQGDLSDAVFIYEKEGKTHNCGEGREGSHNRHSERGAISSEKVALQGSLSAYAPPIAISDCSVMRIDKKSMMEVLHREQAFSDMFVAYLLTRNIRYEADLVDQLFNSSEKRLARLLLLLARFGKDESPSCYPQTQSRNSGADGGHKPPRVSFFMNRFRKWASLIITLAMHCKSQFTPNVVLHD